MIEICPEVTEKIERGKEVVKKLAQNSRGKGGFNGHVLVANLLDIYHGQLYL